MSNTYTDSSNFILSKLFNRKLDIAQPEETVNISYSPIEDKETLNRNREFKDIKRALNNKLKLHRSIFFDSKKLINKIIDEANNNIFNLYFDERAKDPDNFIKDFDGNISTDFLIGIHDLQMSKMDMTDIPKQIYDEYYDISVSARDFKYYEIHIKHFKRNPRIKQYEIKFSEKETITREWTEMKRCVMKNKKKYNLKTQNKG